MTRYGHAFKRQTVSRRAFTLIEVVMSCVVLSMVVLALGYALKLTLVSTGEGASLAQSTLDAADAVDRVTDDLTEATNFTERTAQAVTFTVPDRTADNQVDKIRYAYYPNGGTVVLSTTVPDGGSGSGSGSGGGGGGGLLGGLLGAVTTILGGGGTTTTNITYTIPAKTLTRQVNDGQPAVLTRDVRSFNLDYLTRNVSVAVATPDRLLWQHDPLLGTNKEYAIDDLRWLGETFHPSSQLPGGTTAWTLTRVSLYVSADGPADSLLKVTVRAANSTTKAPGAVTFDAVAVQEVALNDAGTWVDFSFSNLKNLNPSTPLSIVVQGTSGSGTFGVQGYVQSFLNIPAVPTNTWLASTANAGGSWVTTSGSSIRYRVYGTTTQ
jgi:hypothetical protein